MTPETATPKKLFNAALSTSATAKYVTPAVDTKAMIVSIILHNSSASPRTVEMWLIPTGQTVQTQYKFYKQTLDPDQTDAFKEQLYMDGLDSIYAKQDTGTDVSIFINGVEISPWS